MPGLSILFKRNKLISRFFTKLFKLRFNFFCNGNYLKDLKPFFKQKIKKKFKNMKILFRVITGNSKQSKLIIFGYLILPE